jgi:hypothetical protein
LAVCGVHVISVPPIYEKFVTDTNKGGELRTRTPFSTT